MLIVVIPGGRGDAGRPASASARPPTARASRVVYPTSPGSGFWQLNDKFGTSDVTAVTGLIQRQVATGCFDHEPRSRSPASPTAPGFTARMGCELPTTFAAVVPVAAGYRALDPCPANARALVPRHPRDGRHRRADQRQEARPQGQRRALHGDVGAPRRLLRAAATSTTPRRLVTHFTYSGCDGGTRVERYALTGTQHGWPGSVRPARPAAEPEPVGLHATTAVLRFIRDARRPSS